MPKQIQSIQESFNEFMTTGKSANALDALAPLQAAYLKFSGYSDTFCLADVSEATRILSNFTD